MDPTDCSIVLIFYKNNWKKLTFNLFGEAHIHM